MPFPLVITGAAILGVGLAYGLSDDDSQDGGGQEEYERFCEEKRRRKRQRAERLKNRYGKVLLKRESRQIDVVFVREKVEVSPKEAGAKLSALHEQGGLRLACTSD